jgi:hypothetical protein
MRMIVYFIVSSLSGFGLHRFWKPSNAFGDRWGTLIRYGIGEGALIPLRAMFRDALRRGDRATGKRADDVLADSDINTAADVLAAVSFGAGVMVAHILDKLTDD